MVARARLAQSRRCIGATASHNSSSFRATGSYGTTVTNAQPCRRKTPRIMRPIAPARRALWSKSAPRRPITRRRSERRAVVGHNRPLVRAQPRLRGRRFKKPTSRGRQTDGIATHLQPVVSDPAPCDCPARRHSVRCHASPGREEWPLSRRTPRVLCLGAGTSVAANHRWSTL
jgi:hypothetical protein